MKKTVKCVMASFLAFSMIFTSACSQKDGDDSSQSNEVITGEQSLETETDEEEAEKITIWYDNEALTPYLKAADTDGTYILKLTDSDEYIEDIAYKSSTGEENCDVYIMNVKDMEQAYLAGITLEISDEETINSTVYSDAAVSSVTYKDKVYGYPLYYSTAVMVYNKLYTDTVPVYFEDIINYSNSFVVTEENANVQSVFSWDTDDVYLNYAFAGEYADAFGENGDKDELNIDDENLKACLEYYKGLNNNFYMDLADDTYDICLEQFKAGNYVYTIVNSNSLKEIEESGVDFGLVKIPDISDTLKTKALSVNYCVCVNQFSTNIDKALEVAKNISYTMSGSLNELTGLYSSVRNSADNTELYAVYENTVPMAKTMSSGDYYTDWHIAFYKIWSGGDVTESLEEIKEDINLQFN